jgi:hypothetical protein
MKDKERTLVLAKIDETVMLLLELYIDIGGKISPMPAEPSAEDATLRVSRPRRSIAKAEANLPDPRASSGRRRSHDMKGTKLGTYVCVEATDERYYGQIVWLFRCPKCRDEVRFSQQAATRRKTAPACKCLEGD